MELQQYIILQRYIILVTTLYYESISSLDSGLLDSIVYAQTKLLVESFSGFTSVHKPFQFFLLNLFDRDLDERMELYEKV